jgi:hypothetical protein
LPRSTHHQIFYKERLASRGPPSWAIWGGTILVVAYGFIQVRRTMRQLIWHMHD